MRRDRNCRIASEQLVELVAAMRAFLPLSLISLLQTQQVPLQPFLSKGH